MKRLKNTDDGRWLKKRRKKPMSFRTLDEFLAERAGNSYCIGSGEMRKIAQNLYAKAKEEIAKGGEEVFS